MTVAVRQPRYTKEEAARRGDELYDGGIRALVEPQHMGEIVAIDLDSGSWEVDPDEDVAADRLEARLPDAEILVLRVGARYITRFRSPRSLHRLGQ